MSHHGIPGYGSRKFIVTMTGMVLASGMAAFDLMSGDLAFVLSAGIAAYNYANYRHHKLYAPEDENEPVD